MSRSGLTPAKRPNPRLFDLAYDPKYYIGFTFLSYFISSFQLVSVTVRVIRLFVY